MKHERIQKIVPFDKDTELLQDIVNVDETLQKEKDLKYYYKIMLVGIFIIIISWSL